MVGPVVENRTPNDLPRRRNIHFLGSKKYEELPAYMSGWDVASSVARIESTRFITPTKTPEYLAAAGPWSPRRSRVGPYGDLGRAHIADCAPALASAGETALAEIRRRKQAMP